VFFSLTLMFVKNAVHEITYKGGGDRLHIYTAAEKQQLSADKSGKAQPFPLGPGPH